MHPSSNAKAHMSSADAMQVSPGGPASTPAGGRARGARGALARAAAAAALMVAIGGGVACTSSAATPTPTPQPVATLKFGVLPIVDSIPFYVAEQEGFFTQEGVKVELVPFASALERDASAQAGSIDGYAADLISPALLNRDRDTVRVVKEITRSLPGGITISVVASPKSDVKSLADLKGKTVAISHNTIIEYVFDTLLKDAGIDPKSVTKSEVTRIPDRMALLSQGQVDAAVLPQPLTTLAVNNGGRVIADDGEKGLLAGAMVVRNDYVQKHREAVAALVRAHDRAVQAINRDSAPYRHLLWEKASLPDVLKDTFPVPAYPESKVPTEKDAKDTVDWMVDAGLLPRALTYQQLVDPSFVK